MRGISVRTHEADVMGSRMRGMHGKWMAWSKHLFEAMRCSKYSCLVGREGRERERSPGCPFSTPFNCHSSVFGDNEPRILITLPRGKIITIG